MPIHQGDGIQVIDAAVAAMGPDSLVFGLFGQKVAVFIIKGARNSFITQPR